MTQQHMEKKDRRSGKLTNTHFGAGISDKESVARVLDDAIPLQGASHADVAEYVVEIPLRYAECLALLVDGRKVALQNPRRFVGWSAHDRNRSLLFRRNGRHYEVAVEAGLRGQAPGCIRTVFVERETERRAIPARKFIGIDGGVVILPESTAAL